MKHEYYFADGYRLYLTRSNELLLVDSKGNEIPIHDVQFDVNEKTLECIKNGNDNCRHIEIAKSIVTVKDVLGERVVDGVTYTVNLEEENVSRSLGVNNFGDTVVSNNWMFFGFEANVDREGDLREDSTHMNFQLKLNKPLAEALLDDEFSGSVEVTEFNSNVYGWVTVDTLEKVLNLYPELNKIKLVYRKKS